MPPNGNKCAPSGMSENEREIIIRFNIDIDFNATPEIVDRFLYCLVTSGTSKY